MGKNRKYIQKDRFLRYNLYNRIELWEQIATQLTDYDKFLDINIKTIDSLVKIKESEITIVYWCLFNCGEEFNWFFYKFISFLIKSADNFPEIRAGGTPGPGTVTGPEK